MKRIEDYALIGDCETCALVGRDGSIDWLCLPRFDSGAVFAALLGDDANGRWRIGAADAQIGRRYRCDTLILETRFKTASGSAVMTDFMPVRDGAPTLVRIVEGEHGEVVFDLDLVLRFDYGASVPWVRRMSDGRWSAICGPSQVTVSSSVELTNEKMRTTAQFTVAEGERQTFVMSHHPSHLEPAATCDAGKVLVETEKYWTDYLSGVPHLGDYDDVARRSLVTLKALTYRPTGGVIAAATTSLPEAIGGSRNWDYRYCWLRDATLTLCAFMEAGLYDEASAWREWLARVVAGDPRQLRIMYGVAGERQLIEWEVPWLRGFEGSAPVRVGNGAAGQLQIDIFGEMADMMMVARHRLEPHPQLDAILAVLLPELEEVWSQPDAGIWEIRSEPVHHVHSKVMAWVAFDRGARMAEAEGRATDAAKWRAAADLVHAEVCEKGFDAELGSFVQAYGSKSLDASLLFIALAGFLPADDPRVEGTIRAIEDRLVHNGFVKRYDTGVSKDGLQGGEGAFLACSFWLADVYVLQGRDDEARSILERMIGLRNDVGLLPEEVDPDTGRFLGNFPQAFSHIGLVTTPLNLSREAGPAKHRAGGKVGSGL